MVVMEFCRRAIPGWVAAWRPCGEGEVGEGGGEVTEKRPSKGPPRWRLAWRHEDDEAGFATSADLTTSAVELWLHLPLLLPKGCDPGRRCWTRSEESEPDDADRPAKQPGDVDGRPRGGEQDYANHTYFHGYASDAIWGRGGDAVFETFALRRDASAAQWMARRSFYDSAKIYGGRLRTVELRRVRDGSLGLSDVWSDRLDDGRRLAVLTVGLTIDRVEHRDLAGTTTRPEKRLTLADAQDGIDAIRRTFPRFWSGQAGGPDVPGDAMDLFALVEGHVALEAFDRSLAPAYRCPPKDEFRKAFSKSAEGRWRIPRLPWVDRLFQTIDDCDGNIELFGDERAFVTSAIGVSPLGVAKLSDLKFPGERREAETFRAIHPGDHYRLAELDRAGQDGWNYPPEFLQRHGADWLYTRHALSVDGPGNGTMYYITRHHLGGLCCGNADSTEGYSFVPQLCGDVATYYRHMQFLTVFEYYQVLSFSARMARLVKISTTDKTAFREGFTEIRQAFLRHVHLHHFAEVSSQIQPAEMFARLRREMRIDELHREVEQEMAAAADYANQLGAVEQSERGERLGRLAAVFLPLSLLTGALGMNVLVGPHAPRQGWLALDMASLCGQVIHLLGWGLLVGGVSAAAFAAIARRGVAFWGWAAYAALVGILGLAIVAQGCRSPLERSNAKPEQWLIEISGRYGGDAVTSGGARLEEWSKLGSWNEG
jgi:hypothetical protein